MAKAELPAGLEGIHALVQDFLELDQSDLKALLQGIFRAPDILKVRLCNSAPQTTQHACALRTHAGSPQVGFSLVMDLWALAAALGGEGGSCVAVVTPAVEAGVLHRTLLSRRAPGIAKAGAFARALRMLPTCCVPQPASPCC